MAGHGNDLIHFLGKGVGANVLSQTGFRLFTYGYLISRLSALNPTRLEPLMSALTTDVIYTEGYVEGRKKAEISQRSNFS